MSRPFVKRWKSKNLLEIIIIITTTTTIIIIIIIRMMTVVFLCIQCTVTYRSMSSRKTKIHIRLYPN